jgi:hypothetical protein
MDPITSTPPRRALFTDEHGAGMRISWHSEQHLVVVSLWREDLCIGSFRMPPAEAARLAGFIVAHLGRAAGGRQGATRSRNDVTADS